MSAARMVREYRASSLAPTVNSSRPPMRRARHPGRSIGPCPDQSVTSRATSSVCDAREARAELGGDDVADDAVAQRRGVGGERGDRHRDARLGVLDDVFDRLVDHLVEGLGVFAQLRGGAGERLGDPGAQLRLEHGQHPSRARARARTAGRRCAGRPTARVPPPRTRRGSSRGARRAADAAARCRRDRMPRPCPAGWRRPIRARGRAAPSRPGRRGCGRAGSPRRRASAAASRQRARSARRAPPPRDRRRRRPRPARRAPRDRARAACARGGGRDIRRARPADRGRR